MAPLPARAESDRPAMTYYLAGIADDDDFVRAEALGELLMASLNVAVEMRPMSADAWDAFIDEQSAELGCARRTHPFVWTDTGRAVGGRPDFDRECTAKYGLRAPEDGDWRGIARENAKQLARTKPAGGAKKPPPPIETPLDGADVTDTLLAGHARWAKRAQAAGGAAGAFREGFDGMAATVVLLSPLSRSEPLAPHEVFDVDAHALFVVPCAEGVIDELVVGNAEHGVMALGTRALLVLGGDCDDLRLAITAGRAQLAMRDAPVSATQQAVIDRYATPVARALAVAPPGASDDQVAAIALQEWVRHSADRLICHSPMLAELIARGTLHVTKAACHPATRHIELV